jgi:hypothetical protein
MGLRCEQCNKFAAYDTDGEPEISSEEVNEDAQVTCEVRIVNTCADCSTEMTEANFSFEFTVDELVTHREKCKKVGDYELDIAGERTDSGGGRYAKRMYGVDITAKVTCPCGEEFEATEHQEIAASHMDALV